MMTNCAACGDGRHVDGLKSVPEFPSDQRGRPAAATAHAARGRVAGPMAYSAPPKSNRPTVPMELNHLKGGITALQARFDALRGYL
jgi:hypothetical protein